MTDPSDDEKRLTEIGAKLLAGESTTFDEVAIVLDLAYDGIKWGEAAASNGDAEAIDAALSKIDTCGTRTHETLEGFGEVAAKAAAAHRASRGEDVETLKARIRDLVAELELTQVSHQVVVAETEALKERAENAEARVAELEREKQNAFDLGYKAAGGQVFPLGRVLAAREWP